MRPVTAAVLFALAAPLAVSIAAAKETRSAAPAYATDTLHRIDPEVVKKEMTAAGFVFDGSSDALRNPAAPLAANVFDASIRGQTDQFIYRFRKPAK